MFLASLPPKCFSRPCTHTQQQQKIMPRAFVLFVRVRTRARALSRTCLFFAGRAPPVRATLGCAPSPPHQFFSRDALFCGWGMSGAAPICVWAQGCVGHARASARAHTHTQHKTHGQYLRERRERRSARRAVRAQHTSTQTHTHIMCCVLPPQHHSRTQQHSNTPGRPPLPSPSSLSKPHHPCTTPTQPSHALGLAPLF